MTIKPLGKNLVLKQIEEDEQTTAGGIVLPDSAKDDDQAIAEVIAIGPKIANDDEKSKQVKISDRVIYSKYAGTKVEIEDEEYLIVEYKDVLAVVE